MYMLYQLNEKNELTISYHIFFYLSLAIFENSTCQQPVSFPQATVFMKFTMGKSKQASPQPVENCVAYWNAQRNTTSTVTEL